MGFIAALLDKTGADVSQQIRRMLEAASPASGDGYAVATPDGARLLSSPHDPLPFESGAMLGYKLVKVMPDDPPQPIGQYGYTMIFEGRLWGRPSLSDPSAAAEVVGEDPAQGIRRLIEETDGSYAVVAAEKGRVLCGRDPIGVVPLYYGETERLAGAASNKKMLWRAGIEAEPLPPGFMAEITRSGVRLHRIRRLHQPPVRAISMEEAVDELDALLYGAVEARARGVLGVSLGFSGGVDSSLLAHYLDRCGVKVNLVCVGMEGSREFDAAEAAADSLGLPIHLESFTPRALGRDLDAVLRSVEEPNPMKVGVALPLRWAVEIAARCGSRIFYSGNGSDELFGGYLKYVHEYAAAGGEAVRATMFRDVEGAHRVNYERDYKVCADVGVELRLPFADMRLIEFGLSLPTVMKLPADGRSPRKPLLRALARVVGLPPEIAYRRKRAIQYSTGVNRALKKLARREGMTLHRYLAKRFDRAKRMYFKP